MGTREVYEEKLRSGNLHHDPTINPGLGSARCPRCLSLLNPNSNGAQWTITSVLHDATEVVGAGASGMLSAVHGFNTGCSGNQNLGTQSPSLPVPTTPENQAYAVPKFAQLTVTSYYACFQCIPMCNITGYPVFLHAFPSEVLPQRNK